MKAVLKTWHNGDEWELTLQSGEVFSLTFDNSGPHPVSFKTGITTDGVDRERFYTVKATMNQVGESGGVPHPGAPWWSSDFKAEFEGEVPEDFVTELRRVAAIYVKKGENS